MFDPVEEPMRIMTPREVAEYLRVDEGTVRALIANGEVPSFDVGGEPRVQAGALVVWFQGQVHLKDLEKLRRTMEDESSWGKALRDEPDLQQEILDTTYDEGTFGAFLKRAAEGARNPAPSEHPRDNIARPAALLCEELKVESGASVVAMTKGQVMQVVNRYIGVSSGYLGDFTYRTHADFYPEHCDVDYDPTKYVGTTRERFITILSSAPPEHQAKILRGVLTRFPLGEGPTSRTPELKQQLLDWADQLDRALKPYRFAIALSFPGERRDYVRRVDEFLHSQLGSNEVFYDERFKHELARPNLDIYLQDIYQNRAQLIVVFLCQEYNDKQWCGLEWRAIRDIIKQRKERDIMPFRFDDASVPGLFSIDGYIDARTHSPEQAAALIVRRSRSMAGT